MTVEMDVCVCAWGKDHAAKRRGRRGKLAFSSGAEKGFTDRIVREILTYKPESIHLVRLVKLWASVQGLNKAQDGFLNSLGWTLLVLYHLMQNSKEDANSNEDARLSLQSYDELGWPGQHDETQEGFPVPVQVPAPDPQLLLLELQRFFKRFAEFEGWRNKPQDIDFSFSDESFDEESFVNAKDFGQERPWGVSILTGKAIRGPSQRPPFYIEDPGPAVESNACENVARAVRSETWNRILRECKTATTCLSTAKGSRRWATALGTGTRLSGTGRLMKARRKKSPVQTDVEEALVKLRKPRRKGRWRRAATKEGMESMDQTFEQLRAWEAKVKQKGKKGDWPDWPD
eukprot:gnl/MRDRNA2_/MRDRNA2_62965_c0_seq1.p1 gnl/MRDRNA2_/MRDRNA2_62965_c0~~gnl/MRDRNA2_/MRDRNA2_62965_c0_seq1.p1  ORF type:complete len:345 (+),score=55.55 gnl/MRDRNA2_/MRDRNA2_62965_c0_seq1:134-1168(+)